MWIESMYREVCVNTNVFFEDLPKVVLKACLKTLDARP